MANKDLIIDLKNLAEEEYFKRKELELIHEMQSQARVDAERRKLAESTGVANEEILNEVQKLGFTSETVTLLYLVPLIQVAWIDGEVVKRERERILAVLRIHGVEEGSPAYKKLTDWLDHKPSSEFFQKTLCLIHRLLERLPPEKRNTNRYDLVSYCTDIAAASGSFLGFGDRISWSERLLLEKIASSLEFHKKQDEGKGPLRKDIMPAPTDPQGEET